MITDSRPAVMLTAGRLSAHLFTLTVEPAVVELFAGADKRARLVQYEQYQSQHYRDREYQEMPEVFGAFDGELIVFHLRVGVIVMLVQTDSSVGVHAMLFDDLPIDMRPTNVWLYYHNGRRTTTAVGPAGDVSCNSSHGQKVLLADLRDRLGHKMFTQRFEP